MIMEKLKDCGQIELDNFDESFKEGNKKKEIEMKEIEIREKWILMDFFMSRRYKGIFLISYSRKLNFLNGFFLCGR